MDRPIGGWSELVTNHTLDLEFAVLENRFGVLDDRLTTLERNLERTIGMGFAALRHELLAEMERRFQQQTRAVLTAVIAGMGVMGAVFAALVALFVR